FLPVLGALGQLARLMADEDFAPQLRRHAPAWLAQMPWLLDPPDAAALRMSLAATRPERMLRELTVFLESITPPAPLVLVPEDLPWAAPPRADLLNLRAKRREPARLMVLAPYRPAKPAVQDHPLLRVKQTLQLHRQCSEIALPYLSPAELDEYL